MTKLKDFSKCTKCGGIILADTEDWNDPLCVSHYHEFIEEENKVLQAQLAIAVEALETISRYCGPHNGREMGQTKALAQIKPEDE